LPTSAFASRLENLMDGHRAALWLHGHMHDACDCGIHGMRVICKPRGYAPEALSPDFLPNWVMVV